MNKAVNILGNETLNIYYYKKGILKGNIDVKKDGLLFFSIPYENGYKLYIDGKETNMELYRGVFLCSDISKGVHDIKLVFKAPGQLFGLAICFVSLIFILALLIVRNNKSGKSI